MTFSRLLFVLLLSVPLSAATFPGFRVETLAQGAGFASSVVVDSKGTIYFTTIDGWIHRVDGSGSTKIASLPTHQGGNGGLLGMALLDDATAVVHYTTWDDAPGDSAKVLDDVISRVDLATGAESVLHEFVGDIDFRERGVNSEHHGGNPTVAPDGSVFVGIGDYAGFWGISQDTRWNAGKIWRIAPDGTATMFARGVRNPYDLAWDPELERLVVSDNGPSGGDEISVVAEGGNLGWPDAWTIPGETEPVYVWPFTVAPTGLHRLRGANEMLPRGYLSAAFVTRALYYFPSMATPVAAPLPVVDFFDEFILDVTEGPAGEIVFVTATFAGGSNVHRLHPPRRGDCNGDLLVDHTDIDALMLELADGDAQPRTSAQDGAHLGSWGCDANGDGMVSTSDRNELIRLAAKHRRSVRSR